MGAKKIAIIAAIIIVGSGIGYAVSPYFTESTINEPMPTGILTMPVKVDDSDIVDSVTSQEMLTDNVPIVIDDDSDNMDSMTQQEMLSDKVPTMIDDDNNGQNMASMDDTEQSFIMPVSYAGTFIGVGDGIHDAGGHAYTIPLEDGSTVLRLEDFYSTNGPGLRVYLATDKTASDYQSLGDLKANRGNQNYQIPDNIDFEKFDHVLIWCEPFSVLFGSAELVVR